MIQMLPEILLALRQDGQVADLLARDPTRKRRSASAHQKRGRIAAVPIHVKVCSRSSGGADARQLAATTAYSASLPRRV
ncbi:hypothetical protein VTI74DRAFT_6147 [Chaetomium olivicolor]